MAHPRTPRLKNGVLHTDICVIGAGSGGLSVAAGAVQMGASVVLIEKGEMGGDCLNTGCVPSKSLIAAAHAAHAARQAGRFGIHLPPPEVEFAGVHRHIHGVIASIAPHDSVERFEGLGCTVIRAEARFTAPDRLEAGGQVVRARRFVIATGSRAAVPPIPGLDRVPHLTNESVFDLKDRPDHLVVMGGGPIGVEMAQAFRRLGSAVTVLERATILPRDEPEAVALLRGHLLAEGVTIEEGAQVAALHPGAEGQGLEVEFDQAGRRRTLRASHLLVAAGRQPNIENLGLEAAGVDHTPRGITVDGGLRTSNRRILAVGDVAGGPQFTHVAGYHAGIVIRRALFGLPAKADYRALPWVTYTDPELAHVGMGEAEAREAGEAVTVLTESLSGNDRARAEGAGEGLAKIVLGARGRILGATILAPRAGEMIGLWGLAIQKRLKVGDVAQMMAPYPTMSEISKRAAGSHYTPSLFSARTRFLVGLIQRVLP
ncbi:dihydrolipoyl dehydrogenase family protein [Roseococcus suduntuyensis]|uniref:Pyruvate/2-oxoglutarate dehydrogenase complex dihydrolipoamide dehydrogenase (E3) component n=1 Tax=Roseococcus suduntuyensis TaxID=455361 RepID=A0A840A6T4_9PROT|nr:FAD-dependent oxidoreductase [Roseococcus suduntuyensis]MBB3897748.1 pyruvate/2-oxoglutarate dehydrogenase complex dihydrolipoamide dehydrogenase (E3) component [Roseococcus suduntuyensis]